MHLAIATALALILAGCASMDRVTATDFRPIGSDGFAFKAPADVVYPVDSAVGEAARMTMLEGWLKRNGMCATGYEIVSRQPVARTGLVSDVYYEGRCA